MLFGEISSLFAQRTLARDTVIHFVKINNFCEK